MTGMPTSAQLYIHVASPKGTWMQPWLRVDRLYCEPGPSTESDSQAASWIDSPVLVKNVAYWTTVSGYQYWDPLGHGDCIFHGWSLCNTFIGPKSVPKSPTPQMPVVTGVSITVLPPSIAHRGWSWNDTTTTFDGSPAIRAASIWPA